MTLDENTTRMLLRQAERRQHYLGLIPPDRAEAARCMIIVDNILDSRPGSFFVDGAGTAVYNRGAALSPALTVTVNNTGMAERVISEWDEGGTAAGGVGLLPRPDPDDEEAKIQAARRILGIEQ